MVMLLYGSMVLFCCLLYGLSAVLCKYALQHDIVPHGELNWTQRFKHALTNKYWLAGVALGILANIIILQVQAVADLSIVYPLLNFSYVFTLVLGYLFLKETLTMEQWGGVIIATMGTIMLLYVDDPTTGRETHLFHLGVVGIVSLLLIAYLVDRARKDRDVWEIYFACCAGIAFGTLETFLKANTNFVTSEVGHFSIFSMTSALAFFSQWPFLFVLLFSVIGFICCQLAYAHGDVSISVPLITVTQRPITLFASYFVFNEEFPVVKVIGILMILSSIIALTGATQKKIGPAEPASG
jgi:multidrug transporter EmrE-like cation transporter